MGAAHSQQHHNDDDRDDDHEGGIGSQATAAAVLPNAPAAAHGAAGVTDFLSGVVVGVDGVGGRVGVGVGGNMLYDAAVVGGGIVGVAVARSLLRSIRSPLSVLLLESEPSLALHQTGRNSGVVHSGLYYAPGSSKAQHCVAGGRALYEYCEQKRVGVERCGKVVVATREEQVPLLDELEARGRANGLQGIRRLRGPEELRELEPHAAGLCALHVPDTGIVDYVAMTAAMAKDFQELGGNILTSARVHSIRSSPMQFNLETERGTVSSKTIINCAGLQCDRIARMCGADLDVQIVPFRGEYYKLVPGREHLVNNLIYPVPNPAFPFLGVHFTRMIHGGIEAGPNAVLAFKREGYRFMDFSLRDVIEYSTFGGFWKVALKHWRPGLQEMSRSLSKRRFVKSLQELVPKIQVGDVERHGAGVRAQAVRRDGALLHDFYLVEGSEGRSIHVLNAPSPAATASLSIAASLARTAARNFGWDFKEQEKK